MARVVRRLAHDVSGWDASLHPRDRHGRFVKKGGNVQLPDGSVGKVIGSRNSTVGAEITVRRADGSQMNIPSAQTQVTKKKPTDNPTGISGGRSTANVPAAAPSTTGPSTINEAPRQRLTSTPAAAQRYDEERAAGASIPTATARGQRTQDYVHAQIDERSAARRARAARGPTAMQSARRAESNAQDRQRALEQAEQQDTGRSTPMPQGPRLNPNRTTTQVPRDLPGAHAPGPQGGPDLTPASPSSPMPSIEHQGVVAPDVNAAKFIGPNGQPVTPLEATPERADFVTRQLKANENLATDHQFYDPKTKSWDPARRAQQNQIVEDLYAQAADVPNDRKAIIAGGLPGAGKTTILTQHAGVDMSQYLTLNPDDVKEELIKRGMAPVPPGLTSMESVMLTHEESSYITNLLAQRAYADGKNVIWDTTMASPGSVQKRIDQLKQNDYSTHGVFVSTTMAKSKENAAHRWATGLAKYNSGEDPMGGRFIPASVSDAGAPTDARFRSNNESTFSQMRRNFDDWELWDNSTNQHRLVTTKSQQLGAGRADTEPLSPATMPETSSAPPIESLPSEPIPSRQDIQNTWNAIPQSWAAGPSPEYLSMLRYRQRDDPPANVLLRNANGDLSQISSEDRAKYIDPLDAFARQKTLTQLTTVWRGGSLPLGLQNGDSVGRSFTDPGFTSTTVDPAHAAMFAGARRSDGPTGVMYRLDLQPGQPGLKVPNADPNRPEDEYVLPHGTRFTVTGESQYTGGSGSVMDNGQPIRVLHLRAQTPPAASEAPNVTSRPPTPASEASAPQMMSASGRPLAIGDRISNNGRTGTVTAIHPGAGRRGTGWLAYHSPDTGRQHTALPHRVQHADDTSLAPKPTTTPATDVSNEPSTPNISFPSQMPSTSSPSSSPSSPSSSTPSGPRSASGRVLQPGDRITANGRRGTVTSVRSNAGIAIYRDENGRSRSARFARISHQDAAPEAAGTTGTATLPAVGDLVSHNGQIGLVTRVDPPNDDYPGVVQYKTQDGFIRAANPSDVQPAPPDDRAPNVSSPASSDPADYQQWGARAAAIASSSGPDPRTYRNLRDPAVQREWVDALQKMYEGSNGTIGGGGYTPKVYAAQLIGRDTVQIRGQILSSEGMRVGGFTRTVSFDSAGNPQEIHNVLFTIDAQHQGQGIARDLYRRQENWAIKNGIPEITIHADINVGGFAWARQGYDFRSRRQARSVIQQMQERAGGGDISDEAWSDAVTGLRRIATNMTENPNYTPTPWELSNLGYTPGVTNWPGKQMMLGTDWQAVKKLTARGDTRQMAPDVSSIITSGDSTDDLISRAGLTDAQVQAATRHGGDAAVRKLAAERIANHQFQPPGLQASADVEFAWNESLHPRDKDGQFITKGMFVRLKNGLTGEVVGSSEHHGSVHVHVKTDAGGTVNVAANTVKKQYLAPRGTPMHGARIIQTTPTDELRRRRAERKARVVRLRPVAASGGLGAPAAVLYGGSPGFRRGRHLGAWNALVQRHGPVRVTTIRPDTPLVSTQDAPDPRVLAQYRTQRTGPHAANPPKIFVSSDGTKHVVNGHHRILVDRAAGRSTHVLMLHSSS